MAIEREDGAASEKNSVITGAKRVTGRENAQRPQLPLVGLTPFCVCLYTRKKPVKLGKTQ